MSKVPLGKVLIEQRENVGIANGNGLPLIGVDNKIGLHISRQKRLSDVSRYKLLKRNWFAYNPMRINVGSIGHADSDDKTGIISPDYVVFSCSDLIHPNYLFHFIKSDIGLREIAKYTGGSVRERLYFHKLSKIEIELPDIKEQERIVKALNRRREQLNILHKESNLLEKDFQLLRNCILQELIQGKLVKQDINDEPATELLKRIKVENHILNKKGKLNKVRELSPVTEDEIPFQLPKGWIWCRLGNCGTTQTGATPSTERKEYFGNFIPFLGPADLNDGIVNYNNNGLSEEGLKKGRLIVKDSILMVCIGGSIGKARIIDRDVSCNQQINSITCYKNVSFRYLYLVLTSPYFKNEILRKATGSATPIINKGKWENIIIPLPPLHEQQRIALKADHMLQQISIFEQEVIANQIQVQKLLQSVLRETFEGKANNLALSDIDQAKIIPLERKILAGRIIHLFHNEKYFGLTKFQKTLCVCEYHAQVGYEMNYEQEVAGPYDREFAWIFRKEMQDQDWFQEQTKISMTHFIPGQNVGKLIKDYAKHFRDKGDKIQFVLQLFKGKDLHQSELIATLYAAWNNRLIRNEAIKVPLLVKDVHNWSEQKIKYTPEEIEHTFIWMNEVKLIPTGFGKEIKKPSNFK